MGAATSAASGERKREVRATVRARRAARSPERRERDAAELSHHLIELVRAAGARTVTCYLPMADEPDPSGFLDWALGAGVDVLLPVSLPDRGLAWARHSVAPQVVGRHGIREPAGPRLPGSAARDAELLLVPACAVDVTGTRLGWGLGYYDRVLATLDPRVPVFAVVFAEDVLDRLPRDPHDVPVDGAVTPAGTRRFPDQRH
ncbi:5-formyltetrahydrofolate cyclo-ligase [Leucobacter luti]|uniref:5-formyltetrahydrofolate cyclo-ligase n=1 Tax=Leucobacter luti TaxID=340320 RepID=A0A4Q7TYK5_9MICO|nr:5-formyltetrahydrofolate cyclo-ligase [Leucobacter luti]MBL3698847.1 5-formyltetrahydrofolate cyclo-ligase [Leucobacter luti]RZT66225.1 5-formyltetrahydrofolate cyclo-ligase [Leucobacter luti]